MKRAPVFPKNEMADCAELGHDARLDFLQILEEARKHANDVKCSSSPLISEEKKVEAEATNNKKSWKRSLFFWFKLRKKSSKQSRTFKTNSSNRPHAPNHKHGQVSGPLFGNGGNLAFIQRSIRRSTSGPLAHCFTPARAEEDEAPYVCLARKSHPPGVQAFGPIYLVT